MRANVLRGRRWLAGAALVLAIGVASLRAQFPGADRMSAALFNSLDPDRDGVMTKTEIEAGYTAWYAKWDPRNDDAMTLADVAGGLSRVLPPPPPTKPGQANTFNIAGNSTPIEVKQTEVDAMMAALPTTPGAKPLQARKVLVLAHTGAGGFVHASIPLAAKTVEELGKRGDLWTTTVTYNAADINPENLKQYDAIFLDSTTGCFLDDPDPKVTEARRTAFMDFVRGGKGVAGIHAATDSYHTDCTGNEAEASGGKGSPDILDRYLAARLMTAADKGKIGTVSLKDWVASGDDLFAKLDTAHTGRVTKADFTAHFISALPQPGANMNIENKPVQQWPEFNTLIGGFFKYHWPDPQVIWVKIDDPNSPLTAMFHDKEFEIHDETYTFDQDSFSRRNVHVLTSIDYARMSDADKAKESNPRADHDYALSYIRREGQGRVFYEGHGHSARVYAMTPMLEHIRAGIQYAIGDIKADDSPSAK